MLLVKAEGSVSGKESQDVASIMTLKPQKLSSLAILHRHKLRTQTDCIYILYMFYINSLVMRTESIILENLLTWIYLNWPRKSGSSDFLKIPPEFPDSGF